MFLNFLQKLLLFFKSASVYLRVITVSITTPIYCHFAILGIDRRACFTLYITFTRSYCDITNRQIRYINVSMAGDDRVTPIADLRPGFKNVNCIFIVIDNGGLCENTDDVSINIYIYRFSVALRGSIV